MGIKLAIDNYGVDNASLLKLQEVDADFIKIDRSFIDQICTNRKTYEIVKNIIKMAEDLKIDVVAKGVDTTQQRELLLGLKCFYMQGRIFGEPDYLSI
jgi:EAL domain-containing protein (putative c-di-GMP-specific phosphodiesterase class I)